MPQLVANPGARLALALVAVLAALVVASVLVTAAAGGATGGVPTGGGGKGGKATKVDVKYKRLWSKVSRRNKKWARSTAKCESGRNPKAIGGGGQYRGAFQFIKLTWKRAPKSPGGDPIRYAYKTQAVVAVALKKRDGARHWPVCG